MITFLASFPPIQSAIKIDGQGGARIALDIPESEMGNFIPAMKFRARMMLLLPSNLRISRACAYRIIAVSVSTK